MHKKWISKKGKQFGPYYYTTIRADGKVKSFYLGQNKRQAAEKEREIKARFRLSYTKIERPVLPYLVLVILIAISLTLPFILQFRPTGLMIGAKAATYEKIQDDPTFDVFIDSILLDDNLIVNFHHNSNETQQITIIGNISYSLSANQSRANDTVQLLVPNWTGQYFELKVGNDSEIIAFYIPPQQPELQNITESQNISENITSPQENVTVNYEKIDSDPAFDLIIDSVAQEGSTLIITFHHNSPIQQPIYIEGDVAYELDKNIAEPNEQVQLKVFNWSEDQYFEIKAGSHTEVVGFGKIPEYDVDTEILDAAGHPVQAKIEFVKPETGKRYEATEPNIKIKKGQYNVKILPERHPIKEIDINLNIKSNIPNFIELDDVPEEKGLKDAVEVYAIDPTVLNFTEATVTVTAKGTELWKCKEWNFTAQECYGEWVKLMDIVPGEDYSFTLTPEDPAYGETTTLVYVLHNESDSQYSAYKQMKNVSADVASVSSEGIAAGVPVYACWATKWLTPNWTVKTAVNGTWNFSVYVFSTQDITAYLKMRVFKYNTTSPNEYNITETNSQSVAIPKNIDTQITWGTVVPAGQYTDLSIGERVGVQICINVTTGKAGAVVTSKWENTTPSYVIFPNTTIITDNPPTTILVSPPNGNVTTIKDVNFTCNATNDLQLSNITFYWNYSGSWQANGTVVISGTSNQTTFERTNLSNGAILWNCYACDNASQCSFASANWTVTVNYTPDTTPPVITIISPQNTTYNTTSIWFNASLNEAGSWCGYSLDSAANKTMTALNTTYWYDLNSSMTQGQHSVIFSCNDTAGNMNSTAARYFYIDSIPPQWSNPQKNATTIYKSDWVRFNASWTDNVGLSAYIFSTNDTGSWVNQSAISFSGTSNVSIQDYQITASRNTVVGWRFYANDTSNNWNATDIQTFTVSDKVPTSSLNSPSDGYVENTTNTITFNCSATDDYSLANITFYWNYSGSWQANGTNPVSGTTNETTFTRTLANGYYVWNCLASDDAGQTAFAVSNRTLTVNYTAPPNQAPQISLNLPANNTQFNNTQDINFNFTATDDQNTTLSCSIYLDNVSNQTNSSVQNNTLTNFLITGISYGSHNWSINCTDGSLSNVSETRYFTIADTQPPIVTIIRPENITYNTKSNLPLNFTATDNVGISACWYSLDGGANTSLPSCANTTFSVSADGSHNIRVYANDTSGNVNSSIRYFSVDTTPPTYSNDADNSSGSVVEGTIVNVSTLWQDNNALDTAIFRTNETGAWTNVSTCTLSGISSWCNKTIDTTGDAGKKICWNQWANDTAGNWNSSMPETTHCFNVTAADNPPTWSNNQTSFIATYSPTTPSYFNITWQDDNGVSVVLFESNWSGSPVNYSMSLIAGNATNGTYSYSAILPAGSHYWRSWANDTANQWNSSDIWAFTVNKATTVLTLTASPSWTETYGTQTNITCSANNAEVSPVLYRNGTALGSLSDVRTLAAGSYNYTCNNSATQNYTAAQVSNILTINKAATTVNLTLNGVENNITITYPQTITAIYSTNALTATMYRNGSNVSVENNTPVILAAGYWNYTVINQGNENYTASSKTFFATVNKNTTTCSLAFSPASPITYGTQVNVTCTCTGPEASAALWRNGTNVTAEIGQNITLAAGFYNYTCNVSESQNYSSASNSSIYTVNKAPSSINLLLNGVDGNITVLPNSSVNITAYLVMPASGYIELYENGSLINSGPSPLNNITNYSTEGVVNITAYYPATENYSSGSDTHWVIVVNDTSPPVISLSPATNQALTVGQVLAVGCSASDNVAVSSVNITINGQLICSGTSNCSGSWTAQLGTWNLICQARDSSNNIASKSITITVAERTAPYRPPIGPAPKPPTSQFPIDLIEPGQPKTIQVGFDVVKAVTVAVGVEVRNTSLNITMRECPAINTTRPIYACFEIDHNITNISAVNISFCVNNSWIEGYNLSSVIAARLTKGWDSLLTIKKISGDNQSCFEAVSPGLSWFAILGLTVPQVCQPFERQCAGNILQQCNIEGTGWIDSQNCTYGCNSTMLACNPMKMIECEEGQKRCVGMELQICKEGRWQIEQICELGCIDSSCVQIDYTPFWIGAGLVILAVLVILLTRKKKRITFEVWQTDHKKKRIFKKKF
jgi:PGF-pre-PGF domain-containing protein